MKSASVIWYLNGTIQQQLFIHKIEINNILKGEYERVDLTPELLTNLPANYHKFDTMLIGKDATEIVKDNNSNSLKINVNTFMSLSITHTGAAIFMKSKSLKNLERNGKE